VSNFGVFLGDNWMKVYHYLISVFVSVAQ